MPRAIAYKCKTPDCGGWIKTRDVPDDTPRKKAVLLQLGEPVKLTCSGCRQEHNYLPTEKQLVEFTD